MSFKAFFEEYKKLVEDNKANVGDAMEGIFAIGVALYIADGKIEKHKLNAIRASIDVEPGKPFVKTVDSNIADGGWIANHLKHVKPGDKLAVQVILNLKKTATPAFGPNPVAIPALDKTIEIMTNQIANTKAVKKIEQYIVKVLTNRKPDEVVFYVVADGSQNTNADGAIKGDVMLRVEAKTNTPVPQDIEQPIRFSIKTDTNAVSHLSIFTAILRLGKYFNLQFTKGLEGIDSFPTVGGSASGKVREWMRSNFSDKIQDPSHLLFYVTKYMDASDKLAGASDTEKKLDAAQNLDAVAHNIIQKAISEMELQIQNKDASNDFSNRVFNFLEREIFGSDLSDVIKLLPGSISEISKVDFDELRKKYIVEMARVGNVMKFIGVDRTSGNRIELFELVPEISFKIDPTTGKSKQNVSRFKINIGKILNI